MFGSHLWRDGGKKLVITEGEIDALSMSQAQGNKWPVMSVPSGAAAAKKAIQKSLEEIERFDEVIFMFDSDKPGREAALECAALLTPGKAHIATLPLKDANEMLVAGRVEELIQAMWGARRFRPEGVVCGTDLWERVSTDEMVDSLPYPWPCWNKEHLGCRRGEIVMLTGGTGTGKSTIAREIAAHFHDKCGETVGIVALEENVRKTAKLILGLHMGKRIHLDPKMVSKEELKTAFDATIGSGRYFLFDHWGSLDSDDLLNKLRYMVRGCNCGTIILDHISIAISGLAVDDERKAVDVMMTRLRQFVEETNCRMIVICHLSRSDSNHEGGDEITLKNLRGSHSIAQLSDQIVALERDQQSEDSNDMTRVRWLKDRFTGELGVAGWLRYDKETGRSVEAESPKEKTTEEPHKPGEDF